MTFGWTHNHLPTLKRMVGTVISTSMDRTAVVAIYRLKMHPRTRKFIKLTQKYFAHDHHEVCGVGDRVEIKQCAPVSKKKYFAVIDIVHRHPQLDGEPFPFSRLKRHPDEHQASAVAPSAAPAPSAGAAAPGQSAGKPAQQQQEMRMQ